MKSLLLITLIIFIGCNTTTDPLNYLQRKPWTNKYIVYGNFINLNTKIVDIDMSFSAKNFITSAPFTNTVIGLTRYGRMELSLSNTNCFTNTITAIIFTNNSISYSNTWITHNLNVIATSDISD